MKHLSSITPVAILLSVSLGTLCCPAVSQTTDTTPPVLISYSFLPHTFDISASAITVTGALKARDNLSGIDYAYMTFLSPSQKRLDCLGTAPASASSTLELELPCEVVFRQFSEVGTWTVTSVRVQDRAGNAATWDTAQLAGMGLMTSVEIRGTSDMLPPTLVNYTFTPSIVDVSINPAKLTGTISLKDDLSGIEHAYLAFLSPTQTKRIDCFGSSGMATPRSELELSCEAVFPQFSEAGMWVLQFLLAQDHAGNIATWDTAALRARGFPTGIQVRGTSDTVSPTLLSYSFSPSTVDASSSPIKIIGNIRAKDDLSGIAYAYLAFVSPNQKRVDCAGRVSPQAPVLLSGDIPCEAAFPQFSEAGSWIVQLAAVQDRSGNMATWNTEQLRAMGLPISVEVRGCPMSISSTSVATVPPEGGTTTIQINASRTDCSWNVRSSAPWVQPYPLSGTGSATVSLIVHPNFGTQTRTASIMAGSGNPTVTQLGMVGSSDARFVRRVYFNTLQRMPTASEEAFQVSALRTSLTQADLIEAFFNGTEFHALGGFVTGLYRVLLGRLPEKAGWDFQLHAVASQGIAQSALAAAFLESQEWKLKQGPNVSDAAFVTLLYQQILGRSPSDSERAFQLQQLNGSAAARGRLTADFLHVPEFYGRNQLLLDSLHLFFVVLGRDPSATELANVEDRLRSGVSLKTIIGEFLQYPEHQATLK